MRAHYFITVLAAAISLLGTQSLCGGTAQIYLSSDTVKLSRGPCSCGPGFTFYLYFSSQYTEETAFADGKLAPAPVGWLTTHRAWMLLEDISMFASVTRASINLPMGDANANDVPDFFEVNQAIWAGSTGTYESDWGGDLQMTWARPQGVSSGSCVLYMDDNILGQMGPFQHTFEITHYQGSMNYQRTSGSAAVTIDTYGSGDYLQGSAALTRSVSDPFNSLVLQAGTWTTGNGLFAFGQTTLTRHPARPTTYKGTVRDISNQAWTLWIVDTSDSDGDGIPDLSDELQPPRKPVLQLQKSGGKLLLSISGDIGKLHELQSTTSLPPQGWQMVSSLTLTNDPHVIEVIPPANGPKFWRVEAR